jgi:hypothetical protein
MMIEKGMPIDEVVFIDTQKSIQKYTSILIK